MGLKKEVTIENKDRSNQVKLGKVLAAKGGIYTCLIDADVVSCSIKGKVKRGDQGSILVGDRVEIKVEADSRSIESVLQRENSLIRPAIANVDQALIVTTIKNPAPNLTLLDKMLVLAHSSKVKPVICVNKVDLATKEECDSIFDEYEKIGYKLIKCSTKERIGSDALNEVLAENTTVLAGPSGSGKSSIMNMIQPGFKLEVGDLSKKIERGKHTTREVRLHHFHLGGFVADTPGFSVLDLTFQTEQELQEYFPEISKYRDYCKFRGCVHDKEPECAVKEAFATGDISEERYARYISFLNEVREYIKNQYK